MVFKLYVYFLRPCAICPMEIAGLKGVYFEHSLLFTVSLDNLNRLMAFVYYHIPRFKFYYFRKAERMGEVLNICDKLIHTVSAKLTGFVPQQD